MRILSRAAACWPVVWFLVTGAVVAAEAPVPRFERSAAFPLDLAGDQKIDTGFLVVREDRSRFDSRLIRLPVAILRSSSPRPAADPVLYLPGGPGGSALNTARYGFAYPFLKHRDFIVFEPRGARFSEPLLACPEVAAARVEDARRPGSRIDVDGEMAAARQCRDRVTAAGINPSAYTTAASAADVDDLRHVLGYAQWNLYGVSYGTRVGLAILRAFPGTVRSAVFDSVLPPTVRYDEHSRDNHAHALELMFRDCDADQRCRLAFPDLRRKWQAVVRAAAAAPLVARASADKEAPVRSVAFHADSLVGAVASDDTGSLPDLPRLLQGIVDGNATALARVGRRVLRPSGYSWGLRYSVWCSEETPFLKPELANTERLVVSPQVCRVWNVRAVDQAALQPVASDVPVLLLSGEYDPDTPPAWAAEAARTLPRARTVTLRGMAHAPSQEWSMPCAMRLVDAFLRDPAAPLDESCVTDLKAPAFKTSPEKTP